MWSPWKITCHKTHEHGQVYHEIDGTQ